MRGSLAHALQGKIVSSRYLRTVSQALVLTIPAYEGFYLSRMVKIAWARS